MSSKFVAEGAQIQPLSQADEWAKAREKIENARKSKTEDKTGTQEGGKSLYEHLQEQRAAKQEAFEEATKLRHQFRPLNDGEADFLAQVAKEEQQREQQMRSEMTQQLEAFRKERSAVEEAESTHPVEASHPDPGSLVAPVDWTTNKKRRKPPTDSDVRVPKISKGPQTASHSTPISGVHETANTAPSSEASVPKTTPSALVAYDSESDD